MSEHPQDQVNYKLYLEERKILLTERSVASYAFDKTLTSLATGALVFSLAYIQFAVAGVGGVFRGTWLLLAAWAAFGLCLLASLLGYWFSREAFERQIDVSYAIIVKKEDRSSEKCNNKWTPWVTVANVTSIGSFTVGIGAFAAFAALNLPM